LIALYTGARQAEIAQLRLSDLNKRDGIWVFSISDAGEEQRVKTRAAIRKVPVSQRLDLGLVDYAEALRKHGQDRLFPDLLRGTRTWPENVEVV
jgi:integrase